MNKDPGPPQESKLDVLVKRASVEAAQNLAQESKLKGMGGTLETLERIAKGRIESYITIIRSLSKSYTEITRKYKENLDRTMESQVGNPQADTIRRDIEADLNKQLRLIAVDLFKGIHVPDATIEELLSEITEQESKLVPFQKQ